VQGITPFVAELFSGYDSAPEVRQARAAAARQISTSERAFRAAGLDEEEALCQALIQFGARAGAEEAIRRARLSRARARFRRRYPRLVRWGIAALIVVPLLTTVLWGDVEHKLRTLAIWTVCIIAAVAFVIAVEYIDYRYQNAEKGEGRAL